MKTKKYVSPYVEVKMFKLGAIMIASNKPIQPTPPEAPKRNLGNIYI